ncbi:uncharacterized protein LOC131653279 [Vicia villosa]|uniref:uncharacterized protein LOC131653279 n=1 Tax=Vicia villosa TaxID=3911 RepID=UPI00273C24B4|nr:uncharacterized protein LOC131653279 [Vicia villosa]XP_058779356.1 uncharacterized protein LOC131653279 [Vicia villosa]
MRKKLLISRSSLRSILNVTPKSNHLSIEVCDSVGSSKLQWHGWSHAAACVPSEASDTPQKSGLRVPKHERRAMVESFVNKYRSENAGKLPAIKRTQKEVGGSYYVIREIIQELKYKSEMKPLNNIDEISVAKLFDESKLKTAESVDVSSVKIKKVKDGPIQDDFQSELLDGKKNVNLSCELLEEKEGPQTSSWKGRLSEAEVISTPDDHCTTSDSNILEKHFKDFSSPQLANDVKTEEAVSSFSDSVALESQLIQLEAEHFSRDHGSEFVDMENHKKIEEQSIKKASYDRREQPALEDMSGEAFHSSPQVSNDVKSDEAVSSCPSDYDAPERHQLKKEIEQASAPIIAQSGSSSSKDQIHDSKFVDIKNHQTNEIKSLEKAGLERKVQDGAQDNPGRGSAKHKKEQSQESLELDESKIDSSNKRERSVAVASNKSNLWGNLKSFADGILNIWRKL